MAMSNEIYTANYIHAKFPHLVIRLVKSQYVVSSIHCYKPYLTNYDNYILSARWTLVLPGQCP